MPTKTNIWARLPKGEQTKTWTKVFLLGYATNYFNLVSELRIQHRWRCPPTCVEELDASDPWRSSRHHVM